MINILTVNPLTLLITYELSEILYQYNNSILTELAKLCGCNKNKRKDDLVRCIHKTLTTPALLRDLWNKLDLIAYLRLVKECKIPTDITPPHRGFTSSNRLSQTRFV